MRVVRESLARRALCAALALLLLLGCAPAALAASDYDRPGQKLAALTFDDGPGPYSDRILDVLKKHGAKATFFMNGYKVEAYADQVRRMAAEGHQIANHTYDHPVLSQIGNDKIRWEIDETARLLTKATGLTGFWLRPPYGDLSSRVKSVVGVPIVTWNVDTEDWKYQSSTRLVSYLSAALKDGDIALMHETQKSTAKGLDALLDALDAQGFELVTVEELLWRRGIEAQPGHVYSSAKNTGVNRCPRELWFDESRLDTHWACDEIAFSLEAGLMERNAYGEFLPNFPLSRGMLAVGLGRLYGASTNVSAEDLPFSDVPRDGALAAYVAWAADAGVMMGVSAQRFEPDRTITRQELAVALARCARRNGAAESDSQMPDYADRARIAAWAADSVALCSTLGLLRGADGSFMPEDTVTRAMGATVLARLNSMLTEKSGPSPLEELPEG